MIYFRMIFGDALIILTVLFTAYLCRVMLKRIHAVVLTGAYKKIFLAELLVCMILLVCALDIRFSLLTGSSAAGLKVFGWIIRILLYAFAVLILTLTAVIIIGGRKRDEGSGSHIIVLGMALENGKPNKDLLLRVEAASAFAEAHPETSLILTGGNADVSGLTEASVMEELFLQKGLEASRLFLEDRSADTVENFRNV